MRADPKPKKKKKTKAKSLRRTADQLWSKYIKRGGRCERCGKVGAPLQAAHLIPRRVLPVRHHPLNGLCLCLTCHAWLDLPASALERIVFINQQVGGAVYEELLRLARGRWDGDYDSPIAELKRLLLDKAA